MLTNRVLFLDGEALVIDKPAGLAVDPPRDGGLSLENHLDALTFGFHRWPRAVHRLDRDTSGCLLLSRNPKAHARLQQAFERGEVEKLYLAVLAGEPAEDEGVVDLPLAKHSTREGGWRMVPDGGNASGTAKSALTRWRVVARREGRALIEMRPATGRTHQLRVHAASGIGMPIAGDPVYGRANRGEPMLLHAAALLVPRGTRAPVRAHAPLPERFGTFADHQVAPVVDANADAAEPAQAR
ncbi:RluA family pseudouridine synthase [Sphingomonas bacterium]|uniref:RluA family pseudouridine synthase n=1 Tax=Sphingomonas bacterium TaxID=1895847 RepID=UPI00157510FF|nr:RNA pseudouridine synthase [Sphingomonas bacterium]